MDVDDTLCEVRGYAKDGAAYGYSGVKGLNGQIAVLSFPTCAPVIAGSRLRKGIITSSGCGHKLEPLTSPRGLRMGPPHGRRYT